MGRPPKADAEVLRGQLLGLIERLGYENATMGTLAQSVGMSVRTLHRYFPAKADIVWGGIEPSIDVLTAELDARPSKEPIVEAIAQAVSGVFQRNEEDLGVLHARLRLIALSPELRANRSGTFEGWRRTVTNYVAMRKGESPQGLIPVTGGAAIHTAIMEALTWWGVQDGAQDPSGCIVEALRGLQYLDEA